MDIRSMNLEEMEALAISLGMKKHSVENNCSSGCMKNRQMILMK